MLQITIPEREFFDESRCEFFTIQGGKLKLEHSLVAISKWEAKWHKPFLVDKTQRTEEETLDYIRCMIIGDEDVDPLILTGLTKENIDSVYAYINDPMTATTFPKETKKPINNKIQTSETIYAQMIARQIPVEFQYWHITRLITLIRVYDLENQEPKKMSQKEIMRQNHELNEMRKKKLHSKG